MRRLPDEMGSESHTAYVHCHGDPQPGLWCRECLLPSAFTQALCVTPDPWPCAEAEPHPAPNSGVAFCLCGWSTHPDCGSDANQEQP